MEWNERIVIDPSACHGRPSILGTRIIFRLVLQDLANGDSMDDILASYPSLTREDIHACLRYAAELATGRLLSPEVAA